MMQERRDEVDGDRKGCRRLMADMPGRSRGARGGIIHCISCRAPGARRGWVCSRASKLRGRLCGGSHWGWPWGPAGGATWAEAMRGTR